MQGTNEPNITGNELKYLKDSIKKKEIAIGQYQNKFQKKISQLVKSKFTLLCSSGSAALHVSLRCLGIKKNQEVIVPTFTFIATVNSVIYNNAIPVFMDCDDYCNIDVNKVLTFLDKNTYQKNKRCINKLTNNVIHSIIVVHVWGGLVDLESLVKICKKKNIKIIEDAAESLNSYYTKGKLKNRYAGTIGDIGCLSFNGNKIITSAGGGAILTKNKKIYEKAKYLINQATDVQFNYIHNEIGYNYRLSNIHSAIGLAQLENIDKFINQKEKIHFQYKEIFSEINKVSIISFPNYCKSNYWQTNLIIHDKNYKQIIKKIKVSLEKIGYSIRQAWTPLHLQKPLLNFQKYNIKNSKKIADRLICLPNSSFLKKTEITKISKNIMYNLK